MGRSPRSAIHMATAFLWAERSVCKRNRVGAVITTSDMRRVLAIGYNGPAKGLDDDYCRDQKGNCGCLHAEDNAIAYVDSTIPDKLIFTTNAPCEMCAHRIVNANIKRVYYMEPYRDNKGLGVLKRCEVAVVKLKGE